MSGRGIICVEPDSKCDLCGSVEECRPYGPNGENVCYTCGMKDEAAAKRRMALLIFGEETH